MRRVDLEMVNLAGTSEFNDGPIVAGTSTSTGIASSAPRIHPTTFSSESSATLVRPWAASTAKVIVVIVFSASRPTNTVELHTTTSPVAFHPPAAGHVTTVGAMCRAETPLPFARVGRGGTKFEPPIVTIAVPSETLRVVSHSPARARPGGAPGHRQP